MGTPDDIWREVIAIARAQGGPIAARQVIEAGLARSTWTDRLRRERWERPFRAVAVLPGCALDAKVRARAAALAVGPDATVTGWSALHLEGVADDPPLQPHIVIGAEGRSRRLAGIRITRTRTMRDGHRRQRSGVWVASVPRALVDAAGTASRERLRNWLIDARQAGVVEVADVVALAATVQSTPGRGRLLAACSDVEASGADSALVAEVERRLRRDGFHLDVRPRTVPVTGRELHPDLTLAGVPVAIEVDGFGTHSSRHALDLDQRKHNAYVLAGWVVLRISWTRLAQDWPGFVAELREALRQAAPAA